MAIRVPNLNMYGVFDNADFDHSMISPIGGQGMGWWGKKKTQAQKDEDARKKKHRKEINAQKKAEKAAQKKHRKEINAQKKAEKEAAKRASQSSDAEAAVDQGVPPSEVAPEDASPENVDAGDSTADSIMETVSDLFTSDGGEDDIGSLQGLGMLGYAVRAPKKRARMSDEALIELAADPDAEESVVLHAQHELNQRGYMMGRLPPYYGPVQYGEPGDFNHTAYGPSFAGMGSFLDDLKKSVKSTADDLKAQGKKAVLNTISNQASKLVNRPDVQAAAAESAENAAVTSVVQTVRANKSKIAMYAVGGVAGLAAIFWFMGHRKGRKA